MPIPDISTPIWRKNLDTPRVSQTQAEYAHAGWHYAPPATERLTAAVVAFAVVLVLAVGAALYLIGEFFP